MSTRVTRSSAAKLATAIQSTPARKEPVQLSDPSASPGSSKSRKRQNIKTDPEAVDRPLTKAFPTPKGTRKRPRAATLKDEDVNGLPHNLSSIQNLLPSTTDRETGSPTKKPRMSRKSGPSTLPREDDVSRLGVKASAIPEASPKKSKNNGYGLTPGRTPYPNWPHPTTEECEEVTRLLSSIHGEVKPPKEIPMPSLTVSGCGEVPSVLDALIRTRLSAATSGTNSSRAFAGLVAKFGILQTGVGKGSVDWNKVRLADTKEIFEAIKSGGLADVKSKDIKKILQMVWEENQARGAALTSYCEAPGSPNEALEDKNAEVARAQENVLSLDHLHLLSNEDAFNELTKYPGIGPKTASCVLLFCLQRPSFAVDTHVFRLCKWLGWVPPPGDPAGLAPGAKGIFMGPNRNSTYAHCEFRIPDSLKYPLHQLFIKHGKTCPRCRAITGEGSVRWGEGCVIDHLVQRSGGRKEGVGASPSKATLGRKPKGKKKSKEETESELESSELSDLGSDDEVS
ncbi:base excision DNA repair protein [Lindgomyces ingoldianus]|uniref:Base excision DNA repair protein n=1 Tax=Lindgomyces ingoldianus TaxID=673940 RepID=A0ACB6QG96_9PLEO|nr:base excision DNA repair protein [Lindgomyces ingoldianus]KAF2465911.1 base excision DNA repair protein [Lindgomyces ingoldianus]